MDDQVVQRGVQVLSEKDLVMDHTGQVWDVHAKSSSYTMLLILQRSKLLHDGSWTRLCLVLDSKYNQDEIGTIKEYNEGWFHDESHATRIA